ncbi:MAG: sugar ABC transporter permease [Firmicutes bacterium HGW-Firmicutes-19]|jgi:raffinose/stachyose/melibiose transport system permease protein|nr:MAG: sugar ABC transporter permease [Firmicutes bacterium HGW-Firmicutes-19]
MNNKITRNIMEIFAITLVAFFMVPLVLVVFNAAKGNNEIIASPLSAPQNWMNLIDNVANIWNNPNIRYSQALFNSVIVTFFSLAGITISSAMAAWVLVRTKTKVSTAIFMMFVAAMVIPFQVVMFPMVKWFGMVQNWIGIPMLRSYFGIIIAYMGFGSSLSIFMFHGFMKSIPLDIEEAAYIDGCSKLKTFFLIVLPILKPIYVTILILNGIWIWNDFLLPMLVLGKGTPVQTIPLAVNNFAGAFVTSYDLLMTAILMALVPVVFFFISAQKHIIKGMVEGSVK